MDVHFNTYTPLIDAIPHLSPKHRACEEVRTLREYEYDTPPDHAVHHQQLADRGRRALNSPRSKRRDAGMPMPYPHGGQAYISQSPT